MNTENDIDELQDQVIQVINNDPNVSNLNKVGLLLGLAVTYGKTCGIPLDNLERALKAFYNISA